MLQLVLSNVPFERRAGYKRAAMENTPMCHFFAQGQCRFGERCRYWHGLSAAGRRENNLAAPEPGEFLDEAPADAENNPAAPEPGEFLDEAPADAETTRKALFEAFEVEIEVEIEAGASDKTADLMVRYFEATGEYPFSELLMLCPALFVLYLTGGLGPALYEHVPDCVRLAVEETDFPWVSFRAALDAARAESRGGPFGPGAELFLNSVAPGRAWVLCEAETLGFADHRLLHALTLLQRLWRFRRERLGTGPRRKLSPAEISEFERRFHAPEPDWARFHIHLAQPLPVGALRACNDEDGETSFLRWHRHLIPPLLREAFRAGGSPYDYDFLYGVEALLDTENEPSFLQRLFDAKREGVLARQRDFLLDDDALAKVNVLVTLYGEGRLFRPRDPRRDVLKFLCFSLREPGKSAGEQWGSATPVARSYLNRLAGLPAHVVDEVFRILPTCLATHGRALLRDFAETDLGGLGSVALRGWYVSIVVDTDESVCEGHDVTPRALSAWVKGAEGTKAAALARKFLSESQLRIRSKQPLYEYKIWEQPVKVEAVLLPGPGTGDAL